MKAAGWFITFILCSQFLFRLSRDTSIILQPFGRSWSLSQNLLLHTTAPAYDIMTKSNRHSNPVLRIEKSFFKKSINYFNLCTEYYNIIIYAIPFTICCYSPYWTIVWLEVVFDSYIKFRLSISSFNNLFHHCKIAVLAIILTYSESGSVINLITNCSNSPISRVTSNTTRL